MTCIDQSNRRHLCSGLLSAPATGGALSERTLGCSRSSHSPGLVGAAGLVLAFVLGAVGVGTGPASAQSTGTTFLAASNTEPAFDFMTQDFIQTANGGNSVTFSYGGSGKLAGEIDGGVDFASNGTGNSPAGFALFASADEANVDNTIPDGAPPPRTRARCRKTASASASTPHSSTYSAANGGNSNGTSCPGIGSTRAQYTTGRLVIFSCRSGGSTLAPAQGAPTCAEPVSGYFTKSGATEAPSTMAQVWSDLLAHTAKADGGSAAQNVGGYLAIADPKNGWDFRRHRLRPGGCRAERARTGSPGWRRSTSRRSGTTTPIPTVPSVRPPSDQACAEIDQMTDKGSSLDNYSTTSPSSGGQNGNGNYSDPTLPIIFGDNVTYTQDSVVAAPRRSLCCRSRSSSLPAVTTPTSGPRFPTCGVANSRRRDRVQRLDDPHLQRRVLYR